MYIYEIEVAAFHLDIFQSSQKSSQMSQVQDNCIQCGNAVRPRQQGLQCDGCDQWQHRKCNTGITQREYREAVQSEHAIDWRCTMCTATWNMGDEMLDENAIPVGESTRIEEDILLSE